MEAPRDNILIYVIDDHPLMREAIVMMLRRLRGGAGVVEVGSMGELDAAVRQHGQPSLFCLDLRLPDTTGTSGVLRLKHDYPHVPVAVISASPAEQMEEACMNAGADLYLEKSASTADMMGALRALVLADSEFGDSHLHNGEDTEFKLSKRQQQLIVMLDQGLSNRDIATELGISEHTVKVHLWRLFRRIGVKSRTQTLHYARSRGMLS